MSVRAASAHSAYAAAALQKELGRIPAYRPDPKNGRTGGERAVRARAAKEAAACLLSGGPQSLQELKLRLSGKHGIPFLRNSEILRFIPRSQISLRQSLLKSPTRTLSGVSPIALMPPPSSCCGECIYCPRGEGAPQSYTGFEPTTMRAIQNGYSAPRQVAARLRQYEAQGHPD